MATEAWVLLHYRFPARPSARRVYVWRKLRGLGAVLLQDGIWVLPATPRTREHFVWLAAEITELGGTAHAWQGVLLHPAESAALRAQVVAAVESEYQQILDSLQDPAADRTALSRRYVLARRRDYFDSPLGHAVRAELLSREQGDA
ncbi:MAG: hypothetical protein M0Z54_01555 [Thermaerobacter sp.]|nr:hypothetical protein [Thermaerobacter sp.]